MTNQEILEKAVIKAIDGGWISGKYELDSLRNPPKIKPTDDSDNELLQFITDNMMLKMARDRVIFNHDFAKALWGEELHHETFIVPKELSKRFAGTKNLDIKPAWQYHLQNMVISDDPIKYLGENI